MYDFPKTRISEPILNLLQRKRKKQILHYFETVFYTKISAIIQRAEPPPFVSIVFKSEEIIFV